MYAAAVNNGVDSWIARGNIVTVHALCVFIVITVSACTVYNLHLYMYVGSKAQQYN
jgi:hypothetical protein